MIEVSEEIGGALASDQAIVALETTLISHGLPWPDNMQTALEMERAVRDAGAVPATIGLLDGRIRVGLKEEEIERLARSETVVKCSTRDLVPTLASGQSGATTAAATIYVARRAGIHFMATGGLGGVHRGGERSMDISADIAELARSPTIVVCSGAKAILDIDRTAEALESAGVLVLGYRTDRMPGFYVMETAIPVRRVADPLAAAAMVRTHRMIGEPGSIVIANPPPADLALATDEFEAILADAQAGSDGVFGGDVTPYLLTEIARRSEGRSVALNKALAVANADLAARIAVAAGDGEKAGI